MGILGSILVLIAGVAVALGPDDGNAVPWLAAGAIGFIFLLAALAETAF